MTTTTSWHFVRHAPVSHLKGVVYGSTDPHADVSDVAAFGRLAATLPHDAVWITSHLMRTKQTAQSVIAAGHPGAPMLEDSRMGEQNFGDWHGMTHDELHASRAPKYHRFWLAPAIETPPNGESFADLCQRVAASMLEHTVTHAGRDIICFAHGGTVRGGLALALGLQPEDALSFSTENLSTTILDYLAPEGDFAGAWRVRAVNVPALST